MGLYVDSIAAPPRVMSEEEQQALLKITGEHRRGLRDGGGLCAIGRGLDYLRVHIAR